jgi:tetratricopeptide (TPR) repeat protein
MSGQQKCGNPTCDKVGVKVCSACSSVWYCSGDCQKAHWPNHKGPCKQMRLAKAATAGSSGKAEDSAPSVFVDPAARPEGSGSPKAASPSPESPKIANDVVIMRLQNIKGQIQSAFQSGDFPASIRLGSEALSVASMIPEPGKSVELIQLHLNISSAYLQMGKLEEAEAESKSCVDIAEKAVATRQKNPQSIDMLHVTLTNRTFILLNMNRLSEGEACGVRAVGLAESIFPSGDVRLFKPLRALGLIRVKQENLDEADQLLKRAYVCTMKGNGVCNQDTQTVVEDLMQLYMRRKDLASSEKLAKKNYDAMIESGVSKEHMLFGEAAAKYASVLANGGKANSAEPYMQQALIAREKNNGANSLAAGVTLMAIANIREACNNVSEDTERLLIRALEIFKQVEGPQSPHVLNAIAFIRRVHTKRESMLGKKKSDDDDDGVITTSESKHGSSSSSSRSLPTMLPRSDDGKPIPKFPADDGISRLQHSAYYFETAQYWKAEVLLQEAYEIFLRLHGPDHQNTQAAAQNLTIVKHNSINQLWHEVVAEELETLKLAESAGGNEENSGAPSSIKSSSTTNKEVDDVTALFANAGKKQNIKGKQDAWLYEDPNESSGCVIA